MLKLRKLLFSLAATVGLIAASASVSAEESKLPGHAHSTEAVSGITVLPESIKWAPSKDGKTCTVEYDIKGEDNKTYHVKGADAELWESQTTVETCTEPMYCIYLVTLFGKEYASPKIAIRDALGHAFDEVRRVISKAPTCEDDGTGYIVYKCSRCGLEKTVSLDSELPAIQHSWGEDRIQYLPVENILVDKTNWIIPGADGLPQALDIRKDAQYKVRVYQVCENNTSHFRDISTTVKNIPAEKPLNAVKNLSAKAAGYKSVDLMWDKLEKADGYLILRNGVQIGYTDQTAFTDTAADSTKFNYYWVIPYRKVNNGIWKGALSQYVWAIGRTLDQVQKVHAAAGEGSIELSWGVVSGANGYVVLSKTGSGTAPFNAPVEVSGTTYTAEAEAGKVQFYWVYATYTNADGEKIAAGKVSPYTWAIAE